MNQPVDSRIIQELWEIICERVEHPSPASYTSLLLRDEKGVDKVLEKVGEEATEFIIAVKNGIPDRTTEEAADLFFHLLVAIHASDIDLADVMHELEQRRKR
jgi:phosphoribosyl-ATP pyrophosphohydrolase